jgi:uncharacterized damage-inducible protein DinB
MSDDFTLGTFYKGWHDYQEALIKALAPLTPEELAISAGPGLRTIGMIATHMIGARARWLHGLMGQGGPELADMESWDRPGRPVRRADELVAALRSSWDVLRSSVDRWTPEDMAYVYRGEDQHGPYADSRAWVIWHLIEHDAHHGGEISIIMGSHGLTAPDI